MNKKTLFLLVLIVLLGVSLRFWQLGQVPISPDWDEAALGYNAYSILQTGRDEYGKLLPIVLRSFDDYKPALYAYLSMPSVLLFGLSTFAVRLPSAISGVIAVIALFFLVKELFKKDSIALLAALFLAISPWHIQFSRIAFESSVGLCLNILSVLAFVRGLRNPWFFSVSAILAGLSIYVYQSEKVFIPILFLALIVIYRKELLYLPKKYILLAFITGLLIIVPILNYTFTNKDALLRAQGVSIFSESNQLLKENSLKILEDTNNQDILGLLLDNRRLVFAKQIVGGYISHFNLNWLLITGDIARHHAPNMGLMYLFELPFLLIGIYYLFFGNYRRKTKLLVFLWLLIAPIPASVTTGVPHAVRTLNMMPMLHILSALGVIFCLQKLSNINHKILKIKTKYLLVSLTVLLAFFNFYYYLNQYFVQQNYFNAVHWQYGYEKAVAEIKKIENKYDKIIVSNEPPMDQSYMFFLFYLKYSPSEYQNENKISSGGFRENHEYGKYEFRPIDWVEDQKNNKTLYIGRPSDFPENINSQAEIYYPSGEKATLIIE